MLDIKPITRPWIVPIVLVALLGALACGASEEEAGYYDSGYTEAVAPAAPAMAMAMEDAAYAEGGFEPASCRRRPCG